MLWASAWSLEKELQIVVWQEAIESISSIYAKHNSREIGVSRKRHHSTRIHISTLVITKLLLIAKKWI